MTAFGLLNGHRDPWSPWVIPLSVRSLWLSASDHGTSWMTESGGLVSSWSGRDVPGQTFTAAGSAQPTFSATGLGGLYQAVTGDAVANAMTMASTLGLPTGSAPSVMIALASGTSASGGRLFEHGVSTALQNRRLAASGSNSIQVSNGTTNVSPVVPAGGRFWSSPVIAVGSWATDLTESVRIDGGSSVNTATMTSLATATTRSRIFSATGTAASGFGNYSLSELMILSGSIATILDAIQKIEGWLAWSAYPLLNLAAAFPASHPYKGGPP